jgi:hypothetical protein
MRALEVRLDGHDHAMLDAAFPSLRGARGAELLTRG